jgi:hypothetical protein
LGFVQSPHLSKTTKKKSANLNQSSYGGLSNQLLDEEYCLSNSEDEDCGETKIKTKRTRHKSMSPTKKSNSDGISEIQ